MIHPAIAPSLAPFKLVACESDSKYSTGKVSVSISVWQVPLTMFMSHPEHQSTLWHPTSKYTTLFLHIW